jgi:nucleoside-diphosphate-sugar epimerase
LKIIRGDVRREDLISSNIVDKDIIIPLAAIVGAPACDKDPTSAKTINLDAIKLILKLRKPNQRIIFPTTNSGYGIGQEGIYCTEETPLKPISLYGTTKVEAEKAILAAGNCITFRLATVFGVSPRMRLDLLVNDFVYRAMVDRSLTLFEAHFKRNFVYIGDVTDAFVYAIDNFDRMKNQTYNVGLSSANISKWELCEEIKKQIPKFWFEEYKGKDKMEDPDKRNYIVSNEKIEKVGIKAKTPLEDGIKEIMKAVQVMKTNWYSNI